MFLMPVSDDMIDRIHASTVKITNRDPADYTSEQIPSKQVNSGTPDTDERIYGGRYAGIIISERP